MHHARWPSVNSLMNFAQRRQCRTRVDLAGGRETLDGGDADEGPVLYGDPVPVNPTDGDVCDQHSHQDAEQQVVDRMGADRGRQTFAIEETGAAGDVERWEDASAGARGD